MKINKLAFGVLFGLIAVLAVPIGSEIMDKDTEINARNPKDPERPSEYMEFEAPNGDVGKLGHESNDADLIEEQAPTDNSCLTGLCPSFNKNGNGVLTGEVRADNGTVITGVRFQTNNDTIFIDIQESIDVDNLVTEKIDEE